MTAESKSLFRHADFLKLWTAQTISVFGSQFSQLAIPWIAAVILGASPTEMGILTALETAPFLLFGLVVGVWVDRHRRRSVMILSDVGRGLLLAAIPVAAILGVLNMLLLYFVGFLIGVFTVFFDIAYQAYLPSLVDRSQLVEGNSKLETSRSSSQFAGPSLAGVVIQIISAPLTVALDAISYLGSAFFLKLIKKEEPDSRENTRTSLLREAKDGLAVVFGDIRLRSIAGCTATLNFFSSAIFALYILFAVRELGLDSVSIGIIFSLGSLGALTGALTSRRLADYTGVGRAIVGSAFLAGVSSFAVFFATPTLAVPLLVLAQFLGGLSAVVYNVNQISFRQAITPLQIQGRMNATIRFIVWGTLPLGGLVGGIIGQTIGLRSAIGFAAVGAMFGFLWVLLSPVRGIVRIPDSPDKTS